MATPRWTAVRINGASGCGRAAPDDEISTLAYHGFNEVTMAPCVKQSVACRNLDGYLLLWSMVFLAM